jgi:hypothetical protein
MAAVMRMAVSVALCLVCATPVLAQDEPQTTAAVSEAGDPLQLATASPLHLTLGSIAPQNGVAFGPALVGHGRPTDAWAINWSADVAVAPGGAWRAGAYANFVRAASSRPRVGAEELAPRPAARIGRPSSVYSTYWQTTSLDELWFFGAGGAPEEAGPAVWTMTQTIVGGRALVPITGAGRLGLAVEGGLDVRMIRTDAAEETIGNPLVARGTLADDRVFTQFSGGLRLQPSLGAHAKLDYRVMLDRFVAGEGASFSRWTMDLVHEFPFYRTDRPRVREANTPNHCSVAPGDQSCPGVTSGPRPSRERYGALMVRAMTVASEANAPFYLQPTLGGSDVNGARALMSFEDYRFRAPNVLMLQVGVEHTLPTIRLPRNISIPLSVFAVAEQGKAAARWGDLFDRLRHSYATGLTIRAGGFPEVVLLYAWGHESHHAAGIISPSLLGGAARRSLY